MGPQLTKRRLLRWQILIVTLLVTGYAGFYLCRSDFSVTLPLLIDDLAARGITAAEARLRLGQIVALGVMAYALGKIFLAARSDSLVLTDEGGLRRRCYEKQIRVWGSSQVLAEWQNRVA